MIKWQTKLFSSATGTPDWKVGARWCQNRTLLIESLPSDYEQLCLFTLSSSVYTVSSRHTYCFLEIITTFSNWSLMTEWWSINNFVSSGQLKTFPPYVFYRSFHIFPVSLVSSPAVQFLEALFCLSLPPLGFRPVHPSQSQSIKSWYLFFCIGKYKLSIFPILFFTQFQRNY